MSYKEKLNFGAWTLIISIILFISLGLLYSKGFYSISADEAGHTIEAYHWYQGEASFFSIWLPFQKILYGTAFGIYYNLFWVPRILSSLFGLFTVLSIMLLTYELFHNRTTSILSGAFSAIFSCLVIFSVLPMTEIYFFFFTIISIALLLRWKRTKSVFSLVSLIVLSMLGTTVRYEAWIFSAAIYIILLYEIYSRQERSAKKFAEISGLFLVMFLFPLIWVYLSYVNTGDIMGFLHSVSGRYTERKIISGIRSNVLYDFIHVNLLSLNIVGLLTLIYYTKKEPEIKIYSVIFFLTLILMSLITFITNAMPTHNAWRLASIWSIMLVPFTAKWLYVLISDENRFLKFNFILFLILLVYFFNVQTLKYSSYSYTSRDDVAAGKYINSELQFKNADSKIYIERRGWNYTSLLVTSGEPDRFITENHFKDSPAAQDSISSKLVAECKKAGVEYVVLTYRTKPDFGAGYLEELKKYNNWIIYKLL